MSKQETFYEFWERIAKEEDEYAEAMRIRLGVNNG